MNLHLCAIVLLAAGKSSRMGEAKSLLAWEGHTWLEEQWQRLQACDSGKIITVLRSDIFEYHTRIPALQRLYAGESTRLSIIMNPTPEHGSFSSLQIGLCAALATTPFEGVFVLPIDNPAPSPAMWLDMAAALRGTIDAVIPRFHGRGGHPVLLSRRFAKTLLDLRHDQPQSRLDGQIRSLTDLQRAYVEVDEPMILMNLNTPSDWQRFQEQHRSS